MFFKSSLTLTILDLFIINTTLGFLYLRRTFTSGPLSFHGREEGGPWTRTDGAVVFSFFIRSLSCWLHCWLNSGHQLFSVLRFNGTGK